MKPPNWNMPPGYKFIPHLVYAELVRESDGATVGHVLYPDRTQDDAWWRERIMQEINKQKETQ